mmetsp:Transcript_1707/g.2906  ORF Transcript_1707/g.2906 Transcript_1707/m.2906 type:complete len:376 (-) Transcript_1707:954-2081(-)
MQLPRLVSAHGDRHPVQRGPAFFAIVDIRCHHHARIAIAHTDSPFGGCTHLWQVGQTVGDRTQVGIKRPSLGHLFNLRHAQPFGGFKRPRPDPAQLAHMAITAQSLTQITSDGADIAPLATDHLKRDVIRVGAVGQHQFLDPKGAGGNLDILAIAGQLIGSFPINLHGREFGGDLHDIPDKRAQRFFDGFIIRAQVRGRNDLPLGIVGVRRLPQTHGKGIGLQRVGDIGYRLGRLAQGHGQHARRIWIKCACMARFLGLHRPADFVHHGCGRWPCGFVDHQPTGNVAPFACAAHIRRPLRSKGCRLAQGRAACQSGLVVGAHNGADNRTKGKAKVIAVQVRRIKPRNIAVEIKRIGQAQHIAKEAAKVVKRHCVV